MGQRKSSKLESSKNVRFSKEINIDSKFVLQKVELKSNKDLLEVGVNKAGAKSVRGSEDSNSSTGSMKITKIPPRVDAHVQTTEIITITGVERENVKDFEVQANLKFDAMDQKVQTMSKLKAMKGVQTGSELLISPLNIQKPLKNADMSNYHEISHRYPRSGEYAENDVE